MMKSRQLLTCNRQLGTSLVHECNIAEAGTYPELGTSINGLNWAAGESPLGRTAPYLTMCLFCWPRTLKPAPHTSCLQALQRPMPHQIPRFLPPLRQVLTYRYHGLQGPPGYRHQNTLAKCFVFLVAKSSVECVYLSIERLALCQPYVHNSPICRCLYTFQAHLLEVYGSALHKQHYSQQQQFISPPRAQIQGRKITKGRSLEKTG